MNCEEKKILIIGGGEVQLPLIICAKEEGYKTVVVDYNSECIGRKYADAFYQISTQNKDDILDVAKSQNINGVVSNSESTMWIVAYIADKMGLVGNSIDGIKKLNSKYLFRELQKKMGLYYPKHYKCSSFEELVDCSNRLDKPIIIKPVESCGSRGTTKLENNNLFSLKNAYMECKEYSRNDLVEVEEYVEMPSLEVIDGDVFISNGKILWDGLFHSLRSSVAPMIPTTQMYPLIIDEKKIEEIKTIITNIFMETGIIHGEYNIEIYYTKNNKPFVIEINARQGGNKIPQIVKDYCGVDLTRLLVTTSVGDNRYLEEVDKCLRYKKYITASQIYSDTEGIFAGIDINSCLREKVKKFLYCIPIGERVSIRSDASSVVSIIELEFENREEQEKYSREIEKWIRPIII